MTQHIYQDIYVDVGGTDAGLRGSRMESGEEVRAHNRHACNQPCLIHDLLGLLCAPCLPLMCLRPACLPACLRVGARARICRPVLQM